jgi:hypothetical protein
VISVSWEGNRELEWRGGRVGSHLRICTARVDLIGSVSDRFNSDWVVQILIRSVSDRFSIRQVQYLTGSVPDRYST